MKIINILFNGILLMGLLTISSLFLLPLLPIDNNIQMKIVESGSMEPTIMTGSVVVIRPIVDYGVGDIITFESATADVPTTHRIISVREAAGQKFFMTKGDANEEADTQEVAQRSVIGKVVFSAPYVGFVLDFARQPIGFGLLIVLPALLIIWSELEKIWRELNRSSKKVTKNTNTTITLDVEVPVYRQPTNTSVQKSKMMDISRPARIQMNDDKVITRTIAPVSTGHQFKPSSKYVLTSYVFPLVFVLSSGLFLAMCFTGSTVSYLNDIESALGNILKASALDFSVTTEENSFLLSDVGETNAVTIIPAITLEGDSAPVSFDVTVELVSASSTLCDALSLDTTLPFLYTGSLKDLNATALVFNDAWSLDVFIDPEITFIAGDVCDINLVYTARRRDASEIGYIDIEKVPLQFSTPVPKIEPVLLVPEPINNLMLPLDEQIIPPDPNQSTEPVNITEEAKIIESAPAEDLNVEPEVTSLAPAVE